MTVSTNVLRLNPRGPTRSASSRGYSCLVVPGRGSGAALTRTCCRTDSFGVTCTAASSGLARSAARPDTLADAVGFLTRSVEGGLTVDGGCGRWYAPCTRLRSCPSHPVCRTRLKDLRPASVPHEHVTADRRRVPRRRRGCRRAPTRRSVSPSSTIGELRRRNPAGQGSVAVRTEQRERGSAPRSLPIRVWCRSGPSQVWRSAAAPTRRSERVRRDHLARCRRSRTGHSERPASFQAGWCSLCLTVTLLMVPVKALSHGS